MRFHDPEKAAARRHILDQLIAQMREGYTWAEVPCVVCGQADPDQLPIELEKWGMPMRRCRDCGHLFTSPRMDEAGVGELYGSFYWEQYQVAIGSPSLEERLQFDLGNGHHKLQRDILPFRSQGRFLDVGASNGGLVKAAAEHGFQAAGLEPAEEVCRMARAAHGIVMYQGVLAEQKFPDGHWDVLALHDVLEHLFEPVRELDEMVRVLAPGGVLVMETPTSSSVNYLDQGTEWSTISPLEHVHLFSEGNIARLLEQRGLRILELYSPHEDNWICAAEKPGA